MDNTSTAGLSEAINSMFPWYQQSRLCYAYLADVDVEALEDPSDCSSFASSRWFTRGWTLQELIAPIVLIFFSRTWHPLGTKHGTASAGLLLSRTTRIDNKFLLPRIGFGTSKMTLLALHRLCLGQQIGRRQGSKIEPTLFLDFSLKSSPHYTPPPLIVNRGVRLEMPLFG
jgi:hypothetical protein